MTVLENQSGSPEIWAILAGGGIGLLTGALMGVGLAFMTGAFANGMGGYVVLHAAFAMTLMGGWTGPCFVKHDAMESGSVD
jgi:hypothetical protein